MNDDITRALTEFNMARRRLSQRPGYGVEAAYAQAYAQLVRLGHYPKLRAKYRPI